MVDALLHVLTDDVFVFIDWPDAEERMSMWGLVFGFSRCIGFVDGTKKALFRHGDGMILHRNI